MRLSFATLLLCSFLLSSIFLEHSMVVSERCSNTCAGMGSGTCAGMGAGTCAGMCAGMCSEAYTIDGCKQCHQTCGQGTYGGMCNCVAGTCGCRSECPCGNVRETSRCY